jgi:hypothetical protein
MGFKGIIFGLAFPALLFAQTEIYVPYKNVGMWTADTLYVGASFIYKGDVASSGTSWWKTKWSWKFGSIEPINVTLKGNEAGWEGHLWANIQDGIGKFHRVHLFRNWDPPGTTVDLRKLVGFAIPAGAEITFEYEVGPGACWGCPPILDDDRAPKYSGPNRGNDRFRSSITSDNMPNPNFRFGNRWSVVGRDDDGDLEFGFEDCTQGWSDMDFDDVVFSVSNLEVGVFNRRLLTRDLVR